MEIEIYLLDLKPLWDLATARNAPDIYFKCRAWFLDRAIPISEKLKECEDVAVRWSNLSFPLRKVKTEKRQFGARFLIDYPMDMSKYEVNIYETSLPNIPAQSDVMGKATATGSLLPSR